MLDLTATINGSNAKVGDEFVVMGRNVTVVEVTDELDIHRIDNDGTKHYSRLIRAEYQNGEVENIRMPLARG